MSKYICSACQAEYDEDYGFCHKCGARLVKIAEKNSTLNIGDATAISGGVNIDQSKQETHYHATTIEHVKSESERLLEAANQLREKAEEIMSGRGRIDSIAMGQLRPLALQLGISEDAFKSIIRDVRASRNGYTSGLSVANARYLRQAMQAVKTNDMDTLSNLTPRLEAMAAISQDDNVQYLYYLTLSLFYPIKSMEVYERQTDENYWRTFWAVISFIRTGKYPEATRLLTLFDPLRYEKSEEDQNLLEAYFHMMQDDKDDTQEFLDEILGEPTEQIKPLLRAVESTLYEEEADSLEVRFYMERVMSKSDVVVKSQKKAEVPAANEEPVKTAPKPEKKKAEPKQKAEHAPVSDIKKDNKAEELYAKACAASGAKRVMLLQKAADSGSLEAMHDLSDCYFDGEGVEKNTSLAIKWMTDAADTGYTKAQTALGVAYLRGMDGLDQNYALSEKYLLMAANKDNTDAQAFLAFLYIATEDYSRAMVWARKAAQMEHPQACFALGRIFDEGLGVEVDHKDGLKWYEKAANGGDADAQNILGNFYSNGEYVKQDYKKAFAFYQMAAVQGHLWAMYNLGECYAGGLGTAIDLQKAGEWLRKAAEGGLQEAIDALNKNPQFNDDFQVEEKQLTKEEAQALYDAVDKKTNPDKLKELRLAAEAGDVWAMFFYARLYDVSDSVKRNYKLALDYYTRAANAGNPHAMNNLGICYEIGSGVKKNFKEALKWYQKAADQGLASAMCCLGNCYYDKQDYSSAKKWYEKAIAAGFANAYANMGKLYEDGLGVDLNYTEAAALYRKGAKAGDANCMKALGYCYLNGHGVAQNKSQAKKMFKKAAEINSEKVIFYNVWAAQGDNNRIDIHVNFQVDDYKNKKLFIQFITDVVNTGDILSNYKYEIKPATEQYEWKDYVCNLYEKNQKWPNADLLLSLRTTIQILDKDKKCISEGTVLTFNARHKIRLFHSNEFILGWV